MLFISAILLAATAAASVQQQNNTPMFSQKELAYMPIKTAQQHCGNDNNLVCCEHDSDDCERITIPGGSCSELRNPNRSVNINGDRHQ